MIQKRMGRAYVEHAAAQELHKESLFGPEVQQTTRTLNSNNEKYNFQSNGKPIIVIVAKISIISWKWYRDNPSFLVYWALVFIISPSRSFRSNSF